MHADHAPPFRVLQFLATGLLCAFVLSVQAQHFLPQKGNRFYFPDEWLLGTGQPFHFRASASTQGRPLGSREPSEGEREAIEKIDELFAASESKVVLMGDGDSIVRVRLKPPAREDGLLLSASMDKSITAFSAGMALCDGKIAMNTRVADVLPELAATDLGKSTLLDNLKMASGTTPAFDDSQSFSADDTADMLAGRRSFMDFLKGRLGAARESTTPGQRFDYKSQDPLVVGMMVSAAYGMKGKRFRQWQAEHFFPRVQTGDRRIQGIDRYDYAQADGNTRMTIRDWARLAIFVQESRKAPGCYGDFIRAATRTQIPTDRRFARMYDGYGYFVWTGNRDIPNSFTALGYGGQAIVWSTFNDKFFIVFSNATTPSEINRMARLWLDAR